jgi:hypothetical protein
VLSRKSAPSVTTLVGWLVGEVWSQKINSGIAFNTAEFCQYCAV